MYREVDPRLLADFGQHLSLAIASLDQFLAIPSRVAVAKRDELRQLEQEARTAWENVWNQLRQARELARKLGRDLTAYDAARGEAGDIWLDAARVDIQTTHGKRATFTWRCAPVGPARAAIDALRVAVPELVVSEPPPQDLELRRTYKRISEYGPLAFIVAAVTWVLWHFVG